MVFVFIGLANLQGVVSTASQRLSGIYDDKLPEDFFSFYVAGRLVWEGKTGDLYKPDVIAQRQEALAGRPIGGSGDGLPFFSPPFVAGVLAPLSTLSLAGFTAVYSGILLTTVLIGGYFAQKLIPVANAWQRILLWFGYLSFLPVCWLLEEEQLTMFVFLGWLGFALLEMRGHHRWSGAALVLTLVKPQSVLVLLALLVWKRRWQTLSSFALAAAPLVVASIAIAGPASLYEYPRFLIDSASWHGRGINATGMFSWNAIPANILWRASPPLLSYLPFTLLTFASVAWAWRGVEWQPQSPAFLLLCAVTFLAAMLTNPHFYLQDVALICIPIALAFAWRQRTGGSTGVLWLVAAATWSIGMYGPQLQQDHRITVLTPWLAILLVVGYVELARAREARQPAVSPTAVPEAAAA